LNFFRPSVFKTIKNRFKDRTGPYQQATPTPLDPTGKAILNLCVVNLLLSLMTRIGPVPGVVHNVNVSMGYDWFRTREERREVVTYLSE